MAVYIGLGLYTLLNQWNTDFLPHSSRALGSFLGIEALAFIASVCLWPSSPSLLHCLHHRFPLIIYTILCFCDS